MRFLTNKSSVARLLTSRPDGQLRLADIFALVIWFGLATGLAEIIILAFKKFFLQQTLFLSLDAVWMIPLANICLFALLAICIFLAAQFLAQLASLRVVVFGYAWVSFTSLLFMFEPLHKLAALVLAAGLAAQAARLVAAQPNRLFALLRLPINRADSFTLPTRPPDLTEMGSPTPPGESGLSRRQFLMTSGGAIAGLALGLHGTEKLAEWSRLAQLSPVRPDAPNVLLLVLDTVRARNLSLYGYKRPTSPQLERLAQRGVRFDRAFSTAPWTLPSHAGMFTGRWHHELSVDWFTPLDNTYPTLAEVLTEHGYATAGFVANLIYCGYETGLNRGFTHYEDYPVSAGQAILSSTLGKTITNSGALRDLVNYHDILNRKSAATLNHDFLAWLSQQDQRPFFAFINYFDTHEPYLPPAPFDGLFGVPNRRDNSLIVNRTNSAYRSDMWKMTPDEVQGEIAAYDGTIAYMDHHVGLLLAELDTRGVLDNTLVMIVADHGEEFGRHGVFTHGNSLYLPALHVPLLLLWPNKLPANTVVHKPVSLRDLPATVLDLIGLDDNGRFPGHSLARFWNNTRQHNSSAAGIILSEVGSGLDVPDWYPIAKGKMKSLVTEKYHYIRNGDNREELYDFESDPFEQQNLAGLRAGQVALSHSRGLLAMALKEG